MVLKKVGMAYNLEQINMRGFFSSHLYLSTTRFFTTPKPIVNLLLKEMETLTKASLSGTCGNQSRDHKVTLSEPFPNIDLTTILQGPPGSSPKTQCHLPSRANWTHACSCTLTHHISSNQHAIPSNQIVSTSHLRNIPRIIELSYQPYRMHDEA